MYHEFVFVSGLERSENRAVHHTSETNSVQFLSSIILLMKIISLVVYAAVDEPDTLGHRFALSRAARPSAHSQHRQSTKQPTFCGLNLAYTLTYMSDTA